MLIEDIQELNNWFQESKRDFARRSPTPYHVWVSEVMLQQTQASVVVAYYERWMRIFPNVEVLALSPIEKVIKAWEDFGYCLPGSEHASCCKNYFTPV